MRLDLSPSQIRAARLIAGAADLLQIVLIPAFAPGLISPINIALDVIVGGLMIYLLGWHWALLPTFFTEMVPVVDLAPTWTIAVFVVTGIGPAPQASTTPLAGTETPAPSAPPQVGSGDDKSQKAPSAG